jgi:hypothetical protein
MFLFNCFYDWNSRQILDWMDDTVYKLFTEREKNNFNPIDLKRYNFIQFLLLNYFRY